MVTVVIRIALFIDSLASNSYEIEESERYGRVVEAANGGSAKTKICARQYYIMLTKRKSTYSV